MIAEYASIVSAMALLAAALSGAFGQKLAVLPTSSGLAISSISAGAKAQGVPAGGARAAYKRAPYGKPTLKYLYAVGWIGGAKSPLSCLFAKVSAAETRTETIHQIRRTPRLAQQLKRRNISQRLAARVIVEGVASACPGP